MKILAIEFSSAQRSVALLRNGAEATQPVNEVVETGGRGTRALGMITAVLQQAAVEREQIDCIAVALGPGSYTGIRAAISLTQGWQLARGPELEVVGVSSSDCLAAQAQVTGILGTVHTIIDAQRTEFYLGTYHITKDAWQETAPLRLVTKLEVETLYQKKALLIGPGVDAWFPNSHNIFPRAATAGQLALEGRNTLTDDAFTPIYLREPRFVKAPPPRKLSV